MKQRDPRLSNKWWRLTHLYKIRDKRGALVIFKPSRIQLMILAALGERLRARILKYRQGGVTTLFAILYLDDALWTPGFSAAIIAHDRSTLDKIFAIVKRAYENLPESVKPITKQDTLRSYRFERSFDGIPLDSEIYVDMKLRGGTVQALHVSERAYIEGDKSRELEAGSKQAVPLHGRITEETTANGLNEFYDSFTEDYDNPNPGELDYLALFFAWHEDPQYTLPGSIDQYTDEDIQLKALIKEAYGYEITDGQILWYNWKIKDLEKAARESDDSVGLSGRQLMKQEYPSTVIESFQSGLGNVFDPVIMERLEPAKLIKEVESEKVKGEKIRIYRKFEQGKFYGLGCDPSDGMGGDKAAIAIWDADYNKCAEWAGQLRPDILANLVAEMGTMYGEAFAGVENNMLSTILFLVKIYENYFVTVKLDQKTKVRTKKIGWTTSGKSRDIMIDDFVMHYEEENLGGLTKLSIKEMRSFVKKEGGKREHASGKQDDMLFADMIAIQMIKLKDRARGRVRTFANKPQGF